MSPERAAAKPKAQAENSAALSGAAQGLSWKRQAHLVYTWQPDFASACQYIGSELAQSVKVSVLTALSGAGRIGKMMSAYVALSSNQVGAAFALQLVSAATPGLVNEQSSTILFDAPDDHCVLATYDGAALRNHVAETVAMLGAFDQFPDHRIWHLSRSPGNYSGLS